MNRVILIVLFWLQLFVVLPVYCNPAIAPRYSHYSTFSIPARLRPRVNFWIDVFTRYGKDTVVIHHRLYPQVIFKVLDFSAEANTLGPIALDVYKNRIVKLNIVEITSALKSLASGNSPSTPMERAIEENMSFIPGDSTKYKRILKDSDLIRTQTGIKEKYAQAVRRAGKYLPAMERIFADYGLPIELTRLPFVESSFDYTAYSSVGAGGIWQFMSRTARIHHMRVDNVIDERRDPLRSTRAAAEYLKDAYGRLGTWPLALTSYNHGVGGVAKAVRVMGTTDIAAIIEDHYQRPFGFASSNFYPEFLASLEVYNNRHYYFPNLVMDPPISFDQIQVTRPLSVSFVKNRLGLDEESLKSLNYALSPYVWQGRYNIPVGYLLKVPPGFGSKASELTAFEGYSVSVPPSSSVYGGITYKVRKGDTLGKIAKKYQTTTAEIKRLNNIGNNVSVGQLLVVRESNEKSEIAPKIQREEPKTELPSDGSVIHTVKQGDSLWDIARKYGVKVDDIKSKNNITGKNLKLGAKLVIR